MALSWSTTSWIKLAGMAKPMPTLPPEGEKIIEFMPITSSGRAQARQPRRSTTARNAARKRKHQPPLKSTQEGVQIRFTIGQRPVAERSQPTARQVTPAITNRRAAASSSSQRPATRPRIDVASVGMKLSVR